MSKNKAVGSRWEDVKHEIFTPEEIAASKVRVALIGGLIEARNAKGWSQQDLEEKSGVKQPVISRLENGNTSPQLDTVLKLLAAVGKTLTVVPLDHGGNVV